jgi:hypothetical protein
MNTFGLPTDAFRAFVPASPDTLADRLAKWTEEGPIFVTGVCGWVTQDQDGELEYSPPPFAFILGRISMLTNVN